MGAISASTVASSIGGVWPILTRHHRRFLRDLDPAKNISPVTPLSQVLLSNRSRVKQGDSTSSRLFKGLRQLCLDNNILFIVDEIQSGLGRTGKMLCCDS
ncbi:MAG: aminotransferase class III-fold pyridoxal phosphate-dependent enzyme [Saprospiraceae bacterium]|nr:aminotransferase class III-fold pyridoxal phosphate-dependent enzyme [Saprospiraceae bacterium]